MDVGRSSTKEVSQVFWGDGWLGGGFSFDEASMREVVARVGGVYSQVSLMVIPGGV